MNYLLEIVEILLVSVIYARNLYSVFTIVINSLHCNYQEGYQEFARYLFIFFTISSLI